jgi:hypothetical protein
MAKFAEFDGPEILHEGYTTYEGPEQRAGYHWVCLKCFDDLKNELAWTAGAPAGEITQKKVK